MSLSWDVSAVKDKDTLCWRSGRPESDESPDHKYVTARTEAMIWLMLAIDMQKITEGNQHEVFRRIQLYELSQSAMCRVIEDFNTPEERIVDKPITPEDVAAHIGLRTNVSEKSAVYYNNKLKGIMLRQLESRARSINDERALATIKPEVNV